MNEIKINISEEISRFENHLNLIDNYQTIVSGIFGIGKTYFINEFFETYKNKYETVYLSPVNYAVSQNEDIFEYIKYDVIFELLAKNIEFEKTEFSKTLTAQIFVQNNFYDLFSVIVEGSNKIGKDISSVLTSLNKLKTKFDSYHASAQIDEQKELIEFLKEIVEKKGIIYEENQITRIISSIIDGIKEKNKCTVLIIDDLDRIDPEHIFRLFNVFACHFDTNCPDKNKFGFDKIIFVCDIENIRNIFHSKYGLNVDFTGYIDKFYSREIFHYDNRKLIEDNISKILMAIQISDEDRLLFDFKNQNRVAHMDLKDLLICLVQSNAINLRTLLKIINDKYQIKLYTILFDGQYDRINNEHLHIVLIYEFLYSLYSTQLSLDSAIIKCEHNFPFRNIDSIHTILWRVGELLTILDYDNHRFKDGNYEYNNSELNLSINYTIQHCGDWKKLISGNAQKVTTLKEKENSLSTVPYFTLLRMTFDKLNQYRNKKNY